MTIFIRHIILKEKIMTKNIGKITQIISAVVDVKFTNNGELPEILNALECYNDKQRIVLEVAQHIAMIRCVVLLWILRKG